MKIDSEAWLSDFTSEHITAYAHRAKAKQKQKLFNTKTSNSTDKM